MFVPEPLHAGNRPVGRRSAARAAPRVPNAISEHFVSMARRSLAVAAAFLALSFPALVSAQATTRLDERGEQVALLHLKLAPRYARALTV